jgi:hypothetical protein
MRVGRLIAILSEQPYNAVIQFQYHGEILDVVDTTPKFIPALSGMSIDGLVEMELH